MSKRHYYIFLDEGGNLDFSSSGTKYFTLSSISMCRPFVGTDDLISLKYDILEEGLDLSYFHATEDKQVVRSRVFSAIQKHLANYRIDSLLIEKAKTGPALQTDTEFFPRMLGHYLLPYVIARLPKNSFDELVVMTDTIPIHKKRKIIEKTIKETLTRELPATVSYKLLHHPSMSCMGLQIADYCNWAIYRKWTNNDLRSYDIIKRAVKSEFDIFRTGTRYYY